MRADTVAKIIKRIACGGAGFLHSTVSTQDEGQEAHPLGAFYLFGALGKNSLYGGHAPHDLAHYLAQVTERMAAADVSDPSDLLRRVREGTPLQVPRETQRQVA